MPVFPRSKGVFTRSVAAIAAAFLFACCCGVALGQTASDDFTAASGQRATYANDMLRDGLALGNTFERDVNRALCVDPDKPQSKTAPRYDFAKYAEQYFESALSPENLISNVAASATSAAFHSMLHDDFSSDDFQRRLAENLTRKGVSDSINFVTASLLQQDVRFIPSGDHGIRRRVKYAFLQTFIDRGRDGNEIAVPRIAASFGTAWVLETWHPWMQKEPNLWSHAGFIFGSYAARSFWTEFKPDIKHEFQVLRKRNKDIIEP